jgi:hypothetical protein
MWFIVGLTAFAVITALAFQHKLRPTWSGLRWSGGGEGGEYAIKRQKGKLVDVRFGLKTLPKLQFTLCPEKWYDRLAKLLTLSAEYQVGDDAFDRAVYILSDSETVCRVLLADARLRADLMELINVPRGKLRVTHVHANAGKLWVRMKPTFETVADEDVQYAIGEIAPVLRTVEKRIRAVLKARPVDRDRSFLVAAAFAAISLGFAINGVVALVVFAITNRLEVNLLDHQPLLRDAALATAAVIGSLVLASRLLLGRTSRGHLVLAELVTFGLLGAFATAWFELRELNIDFDNAAAVERSVQVVGQDAYRRKSGMKYRIALRDWTGGDGARSFEVSESLYRRVEIGKTIRLSEHPGYLGYRWIDGMRH